LRWELRLRAAERGVFKAVEMRRLLAGAGLEVSAGKMSGLWSATRAPVSVRLDDLEVICRVLDCDPAALLVLDPAPGPSAPEPSTEPSPPPLLLPLPAAETVGEAWADNTSRRAARRAGPVRPSLPPV
ncbi:helix-turn-helix domain-containing protein, partial [Streptomyces sp. IBSBF 2806]|uniref:helix-turn-helix domain-containing protein n=1 Tax=Streptomyces sp. IBSBF 2806 TaxID=2903529 RepID=UPI002FDC0B4C